MVTQYQEDMVLSMLDMDATVNLTAGQWTDLITYTVPNQENRFFGYGDDSNGVDKRGVFKLAVKTGANAAIPGNARIVATDKNRLTPKPGISPRSESLESAEGVRLGRTGLGARPNSLLVIQFKPDATAVADKTNCTLNLPTTVRQGADVN